MKKKLLIIAAVLLVLIVVCVGILGINVYAPNSRLDRYNVVNYSAERSDSGVKVSFDGADGHRTLLEFRAEPGTQVKLQYNTKLQSGDFSLMVLDPGYKILETYGANTQGTADITVGDSGVYRIRLVCKKAAGNLEVNVSGDKPVHVGFR